MRIKNLSIKNLGKHKSLDASLDGAVVALLGPNGSGKSTILKIIHFLLTAWTPPRETQESFIRKVDPELEVEYTQGTAEMDFLAQGDVYRITRKIGSPSSRRFAKLDINGKEIKDETYTGAAEIQAQLNDILGADKYAIDSAVFPEQGQLDKILFGSQADREELLVKLLLLGHMQKVADVAAGKIKTLGSEIQDFSVLHDELQSSRNAVESELAYNVNLLSKTSDWNTEVQQLTRYIKLSEDINTHGISLRNAQNIVTTTKSNLDSLLLNLANELDIEIKSVDDLKSWISRLSDAIKVQRQNLDEVNTLKNNFEKYEIVENRFYSYRNSLEHAKKNLPSLPDANSKNELIKRLNIQKEAINNKKLLDDHASSITTHTVTLAENEKLLALNEGYLKDGRVKLSNLIDQLSLCKTIIDTCDIARNKSCVDGCPVCGSDLNDVNLDSRYNEYKKKYDILEQEQITLNKEISDLSKEYRELDKSVTLLKNNINNSNTEIARLTYILQNTVKEDIDLLENELIQHSENENKYYAAHGALKKINEGFVEAALEYNSFTKEQKELFDAGNISVEDLNNDIQEINIKLTRWDGRMKTFNSALEQAIVLNEKININTDQASQYLIKINEIEKEKTELFNSFTTRLNYILNTSGINPAEVINNKQQEYTELKIKVNHLKGQADTIKKRLLEIEAKIKLDEDKREVIKDLQSIVTAFSRQGIPMAYVQHKFDNLVSMTQENLEIMDANFAIIPNPNKPVSLQFYRTDEPGQVLFDHDKLSGGQKVRLSIAFLLAVQQLVIPELGFLVLDEPSTHLDEESRENLKDLLLNLNQRLEATDIQILVCDHAKELEPAFSCVINLN